MKRCSNFFWWSMIHMVVLLDFAFCTSASSLILQFTNLPAPRKYLLPIYSTQRSNNPLSLMTFLMKRQQLPKHLLANMFLGDSTTGFTLEPLLAFGMMMITSITSMFSVITVVRQIFICLICANSFDFFAIYPHKYVFHGYVPSSPSSILKAEGILLQKEILTMGEILL